MRQWTAAGGEEENQPTPTQAEANLELERWYRACDLIAAAIRPIPKRHRIGWLQATQRHLGQRHGRYSEAELGYLDWSRRYLQGPKRTQPNGSKPQSARSSKSLAPPNANSSKHPASTTPRR